MKTKLVIGGVFLVALGYYFGTPFWVATSMKSAAEVGDGERLAEHVDFVSVRKSLKEQMRVSIMAELAEDTEDNPFGMAGAAIAASFVDGMVDGLVTPSGLINIMSKGELDLEEDRDETPSDEKPFENASYGFTSLSRFVVEVVDEQGDSGKFVFRPKGLTWKLTEVLIRMEQD